MNRTKIEYLTHTWPIVTGCSQPASVCACRDQCWARATHRRFKGRLTATYNLDFSPRINYDTWMEPNRLTKPARIGVGFQGDIACCEASLPTTGDRLRDMLFRSMNFNREHQFFILTKSPEKLAAWGQWPDNAWVGGSATGNESMINATNSLAKVEAKNKWLSFEPLMESVMRFGDGVDSRMLAIVLQRVGVSWVVIGGWSRYSKRCPPPKQEWIEEIERACDQAGVRVWEKNNLATVLNRPLRQELPV